MNYNELYSRKNKQRPKRNNEEKRNLRKILLGAVFGGGIGIAFAAIAVLVYNLAK